MTRTKGWEHRLKLVMEKHMALPSEYGTSDCLIIALDAIEAVTGIDPYPAKDFDREYTTAQGALKCMKKAGFKNVEQVLKAKFEEEVPTSLAQRGDVGVATVEGQTAAGVFTQMGFMTRGTDRVLFLNPIEVKTAFKVR